MAKNKICGCREELKELNRKINRVITMVERYEV